MSLYRINIRSVGRDWTDEKSSYGDVTEANGALCFKYCLDGDECLLSVTESKVIQERRGKQCVKIKFIEGVKTDCLIGSDGFSGSYEVLTRSIKFISGKGGYKLSLEYINGSDNELIKLIFTAVKKGFKNEN